MKTLKKTQILNTIFSERNRDYTFSILFFLIFSIFIFYAIRPSLTTAFALRKEEEDLIKINQEYEKRIIDIARIQGQIEENRDKLYLIDQALPEFPHVGKIVDDLNKIDEQSNFTIKKAYLGEVNLGKSSDKQIVKNMKVIIEGEGSFDGIYKFINSAIKQRRLKLIQQMQIQTSDESTASSSLKVNIEFTSFHL